MAARLGEVFAYPLKADPLIVIGIVAMCSIATLFTGILSILVELGLLAYLYRYCASVLGHTAKGNREPPEHTAMVASGVGWDQIWLLLLFIAFGFAVFRTLGAAVGVGIIVLQVLLFPAACMMLCMTQTLSSAINPGKWLQMIARIGLPYLLLVGFFICALIAKVLFAVWLAGLPSLVVIVFYNLVAGYFTVACFFLMGDLLYQSHEQLGIEQDHHPDRTIAQVRSMRDPDQAVLDLCNAHAQAGQLERAALEMGAHIKMRGGSKLVHQSYRGWLLMLGMQNKLLEHGKSFLSVLIAQEQWPDAVALYEENLRLDPTFRPQQDEEFLPLASAMKASKPEQALTLLNGFQSRFPKSKMILPTLLLAAKILAEQLDQIAPAQKILAWLESNFAAHPGALSVREYAAFLERLAASKLGPR
jgi:tetratricopeptide (TPR) repeat protein